MEIKETDKVKVSVIIPMYNVSKFLYRSVNSLYAQDLQGIELIFVDDCSTDDTIKVLHSLLRGKDGIKVKVLYHSINLGVAVARNTALDAAGGEYLYYVDADDYIEPDTLSTLYKVAKSSNADIVGCDWFLSFRKKERRMYQPKVADGEDAFKKMAKGVMRWNLWMFLVKSSIYKKNNLRFIPQQNMGEDMMMMMKLTLLANKIVSVHRHFYHYVQSNRASLTKNYSEAITQITENLNSIEQFLLFYGRNDLKKYLRFLELTLKQPYLISDKTESYELWQTTYPHANKYAGKNDESSWYTNLLQIAAKGKIYFFLKMYYWLVVRLRYGVLYK